MEARNQFGRGLLLVCACALFAQSGPASSSEFIDDLPELVEDADRAGAMIWLKPGVDRSVYTRVMVEPVTIFVSPDSKEKGLNADELKALADTFHHALTSTLEPEVPVVSQPGAGVLYLRTALVDVKFAKKKRGLLGYTPVGFVVTAAADAAGARIQLQDVTLEIEAIDSVSGERVAVVVDEAPETVGEDKPSWESVNQTFVFYAERFKQRLQASQ